MVTVTPAAGVLFALGMHRNRRVHDAGAPRWSIAPAVRLCRPSWRVIFASLDATALILRLIAPKPQSAPQTTTYLREELDP
ncbi:MAG TPA: hypothetical protein VF981_06660 [Gemmatimonadaceae bacterium]